MPKRTKTITAPTAIREALQKAEPGDLFEVTFRPLTVPVWLQAEDPDEGRPEELVDAAGDAVSPGVLADIVCGRPVRCEVDACNGDDEVKFTIERHDTYIWVAPSHVAALRKLPGPKTVEIDGLSYQLTLKPDGTASVGCQTLTRKGCEQAFRALAEHLGYEVTD